MDFSSLILLLVIPLELLLQKWISRGPKVVDSYLASIAMLIVSLVSLFVAIGFRGELLRRDWAEYKKKRSLIGYSLGLAFISAFLINIFDSLNEFLNILPLSSTVQLVRGLDCRENLIVSFIPLISPVVEEVVFRYELYYRHRDGWVLDLILASFSSAIFALFHLRNYGFHYTKILPLFLIGLIFCYSYKKTDNIWTTIVGHIIYNGFLILFINL